MTIHLYGLLRLDEQQQSSVNLSTRDFSEQLTIYARSAMTLARSLHEHGISFTLLTNRKDLVTARVHAALPVEEIPFTTQVPHGTTFYSAHFKLDAFRYLATRAHQYVGLCDLDMICLRDIPTSFQTLIAAKIPLYYDISDQVIPAYGHEVIINNLQSIHGFASEGRWYGGEFISGPPSFFDTLTRTIEEVYPRYIANISLMHHVGDESYTSAALEILRRKLGCLGDAGTLGIVGRFWNAPVKHHQMPFDYFSKCFLLHLPADKPFLANFNQETGSFLGSYTKMLRDARSQ
jgi:hypothetical protein